MIIFEAYRNKMKLNYSYLVIIVNHKNMKKNTMNITGKTYRKKTKLYDSKFKILCFVLMIQKSQVHSMLRNSSSRVQPLITRERELFIQFEN